MSIAQFGALAGSFVESGEREQEHLLAEGQAKHCFGSLRWSWLELQGHELSNQKYWDAGYSWNFAPRQY